MRIKIFLSRSIKRTLLWNQTKNKQFLHIICSLCVKLIIKKCKQLEISGEQLRELRVKRGLTQTDIANELLQSLRTIQNWEQTGKIPKNKQVLVEHLFKEYAILGTEIGKTAQEPAASYQTENAVFVEYPHIMMTPLVTVRARAGFLSGYGDPEYIEDLPKVPWEVDREFKGHYVTFEVAGDSMESEDDVRDSLYEDDKLLARELGRHHWVNRLHYEKYDFVIVHKEMGIVIKRIIDHDVENGNVTCHSLNSYYEDFTVHLDDVIALYNVIEVKRRRKRR